MIYIKHRVNKLKEIKDLSTEYGAEIDLRSYGKRLILNHEPFQDGVLFKSWLEEYNHKFLLMHSILGHVLEFELALPLIKLHQDHQD